MSNTLVSNGLHKRIIQTQRKMLSFISCPTPPLLRMMENWHHSIKRHFSWHSGSPRDWHPSDGLSTRPAHAPGHQFSSPSTLLPQLEVIISRWHTIPLALSLNYSYIMTLKFIVYSLLRFTFPIIRKMFISHLRYYRKSGMKKWILFPFRCSMEILIALFCLEKTLCCLDEIKCQPFPIQDIFTVRTRKFFYK